MKQHKKKQWNLTWLKSESVKLIWDILSSNGAKVYFVGGCVRDTIQGREVKDIDIATDALPSEVENLFQTSGLKVIKTGYEHGSITVVSKQDHFEVTTFRSDLITDGRHSKVRFSKDILEDAKRRDFTMNAIYMKIDGTILDPICGWKDMINGCVRFIGKPEKRINEDYLRILRYFRFLSTYGDNGKSIEPSIIDACSNAISGLKTLSHDRVWGELQRILLADNPYLALKIMKDTGILEEILPFSKIDRLYRFLQIDSELKLEFREINRLAVLNISYVQHWAKNFPLKREQRRWLNELLVNLEDSSSLKVKGYKYKLNLATAGLAVYSSDTTTKLDKNDLAKIEDGALKQFPIKPSDLLKHFPPSKELGEEFKRLKAIWFASDLEFDKRILLSNLKNS